MTAAAIWPPRRRPRHNRLPKAAHARLGPPTPTAGKLNIYRAVDDERFSAGVARRSVVVTEQRTEPRPVGHTSALLPSPVPWRSSRRWRMASGNRDRPQLPPTPTAAW